MNTGEECLWLHIDWHCYNLGQMFLNADILQNFRSEKVNPEKQKAAKENFHPKVKKLKPSLR